MEDLLISAIAELWQEILGDLEIDLPGAVADRLEPLAKRLDRTFASRI